LSKPSSSDEEAQVLDRPAGARLPTVLATCWEAIKLPPSNYRLSGSRWLRRWRDCAN